MAIFMMFFLFISCSTHHHNLPDWEDQNDVKGTFEQREDVRNPRKRPPALEERESEEERQYIRNDPFFD